MLRYGVLVLITSVAITYAHGHLYLLGLAGVKPTQGLVLHESDESIVVFNDNSDSQGIGQLNTPLSTLQHVHTNLFISELGDSTEDEIHERDVEFQLPDLQSHPLPAFLAAWHASEDQGDYFDAIAPTVVGYLVWTQFPLKIYVESFLYSQDSVVSEQSHDQWSAAVVQAVNEWSAYVPMEFVSDSEQADISFWAIAPPLQVSTDDSGLLLGRVRSAITQYEFYIQENTDGVRKLMPRYEVLLKPGQAPPHMLATARHELGHALGIWGHSPLPNDALYFSQVQTPPEISSRDINTLKQIYQQPTQLGWPL